MSASLREQVRQRAGGCCEYCRLPASYDPRPFHLDHIRPQKHDGPTTLDIMAYCCAACSLYKGPNPAGFDGATDTLQPLFNPRLQIWSEHFTWNEARIEGLTPVGRATINVLRINETLRVVHRELLIKLGVMPT